MQEKELILETRKRLEEIINDNAALCSCILFSGGLDTSILVTLKPRIKAITIVLETFGEDAPYAKLVAEKLNLDHFYQVISIDEAINAIPEVIKILKSFDPAIPNDLVVYFGLKLAKELGIKEVMTGDGADELFAGYDYMKNIENVDEYIKMITQNMSFSANELGNFFNIKIIQPYMEKEFIEFAVNIPAELKIKKENGALFGKWLLRKAFEELLPKEIIWQNKRPLEVGSGMSKLRKIIETKISDEEFTQKSKVYTVKFINKEHMYYYEIYRKIIGEIPKPKNNEKSCFYCGGGMAIHSFHCKICGGTISWKR